MRPFLTAAAALAFAAPAFAQAPAQVPARIRGTIQSFAGNVLTVEPREGGTQRIALAPGYVVSAVVPTTPDAIKPGTEIGIVGFGPADHQRAAVINLFPAGQKVNEAQFPWDSAADSTMTNAPVAADVTSADGRELTVTVNGKPVRVTVPQNAILQTTEPGTPAMLTAGAKVLVFAQRGADGALSASRVNVGKDGFAPAN